MRVSGGATPNGIRTARRTAGRRASARSASAPGRDAPRPAHPQQRPGARQQRRDRQRHRGGSGADEPAVRSEPQSPRASPTSQDWLYDATASSRSTRAVTPMAPKTPAPTHATAAHVRPTREGSDTTRGGGATTGAGALTGATAGATTGRRQGPRDHLHALSQHLARRRAEAQRERLVALRRDLDDGGARERAQGRRERERARRVAVQAYLRTLGTAQEFHRREVTRGHVARPLQGLAVPRHPRVIARREGLAQQRLGLRPAARGLAGEPHCAAMRGPRWSE